MCMLLLQKEHCNPFLWARTLEYILFFSKEQLQLQTKSVWHYALLLSVGALLKDA